MMKYFFYWLAAWGTTIALFPHSGKKDVQRADLVLWNGRIATMDKADRIVSALAIRGDRILAIGDDGEIKRLIGPETRVIDLLGRFAMPGFIESHGHFLSLGKAKMQLNLASAASWEEMVAMVRQAALKSKPGAWIRGRGWHQEKWKTPPQPSVEGLPLHRDLSEATPENPVIFVHASGHSCLVNARAMDLAGITAATPDPEGGRIVRDAKGIPTGALLESAQDLVYRAMERQLALRSQEEILEEMEREVSLAQEECLQMGVTTFHDAGASFADIDSFRRLAGEGRLKVRLYVMIGEENEALAVRLDQYRIIGFADNHLTVRAIKRLIDGALGSHGAWLLDPYESLPGSTGLNVDSVAKMKKSAELAIRHGFQLCTHAIGDRANRETLNIYEEAFLMNPEKKDLRWRIEHAQHLHPADIPRFGRLGVIADMQGIHCTSDGSWVIKRLGKERAESGAYMWRSLIDSGAVICNGTDVPVENEDPIACFYSSVTRKTKSGGSFFPAQRMTRSEALRSYTTNGAYAAFEENLKGSLEKGKLADIVVLSDNLLTIADDDILRVKVVYTIVGGKILYEAR